MIKNSRHGVANYYIIVIVILLTAGSIIYLEAIKGAHANASTQGYGGYDIINSSAGLATEQGYPKAPEINGATGYINTNGTNITLASLRGRIVLVDFWTYSCINCLRTLPYLEAWYARYKDQGLVIIGVHTPEFNFEKDYNNVLAAVHKYNITYPVVLDSNYAIWGAYYNEYWPHEYLIDRNGYIRHDHIGEGGYSDTEGYIQELLGENSSKSTIIAQTMPDNTPTTQNTPEIYLGYGFAIPRGEIIGNNGGIKPDANYTYNLQNDSPLRGTATNVVYLENTWYASKDSLQSLDNSTIYLNFTAKNANIVLDGNGTVDVYIDGDYIKSSVAGSDVQFAEKGAYINILGPRLYDIYDGDYGSHELRLVFSRGINAYSFTFG